MTRRTFWIPWLAILAATVATSAEFHVDARVDVIAALTVQVGEFPQDPSEQITFRIHGSQDQCLQWSWSDRETGIRTIDEPLVVLAEDGTSTQSLSLQSFTKSVLHVDLN